MDQRTLQNMLSTDDEDIAAAILEEAREIADRMVFHRVESVERRATTLQSVVAIAASFSLAGGTLLITHVHATVWRTVMSGGLLWVVGSLGLCGLRATQAAVDVHGWAAPPRDRIAARAGQTLAESHVERAAHLLRAAGWNSQYARWKVTMMAKARGHLQRAVLGIAALIAVLVAYGLR
ncbi:MAG: hypothetical protein QOK16_3632 [Solirubrobacteraceae bacterium]|jgi:hypothetical protein|nr:hypothetical protein [Solirubrobacteraceae bacterium]